MVGEQFPCVLYNIIQFVLLINLYNKKLRKIFVGKHYPWNIFNSELFPNYGSYTTVQLGIISTFVLQR